MVSPDAARRAAAAVEDPEIRTLTIEDLGILRGVEVDAQGRVTVRVMPTYSGCPAMDVIRRDIVTAVRAAGYPSVEVRTELSPAWSTDMINEAGRGKLAAAGIAPPGAVPPGPAGGGPVPLALSVRCPRCSSPRTEELSRFGATACKSLWRCRACGEPFERVKPL